MRIAAVLGAHALELWAATVVATLLIAALALRTRRRRIAALREPAAASPGGVALRAGIGFVSIVVAAALFAGLAQGHDPGAAIGRLDEAFALALRAETPPAVLIAFSWVTHAGDPATLTVIGIAIGAALLFRGRVALACAWSAALLGNAVLNVTLKSLFMRIRPVHDTVLALAEGYSFPSGHTSGAVACYGMLAYLAVRLLSPATHRPALCAAAVLAVSTAFSRVFLGVHHPSDVVAGALSGGAWLAVCIAAVELHRRRAPGHDGR